MTTKCAARDYTFDAQLSMTLPPGTRIGVYEVSAPIGAGGMGEVYRARDTRLDRDVALKILPDVFATNTDRVARFELEAKTLAALNHPHIAQIYGFEQSDGRQFIVMELVIGETLDARIARGPLPPREALSIARQIAEALAAAHATSIVHRDLKPANIALTANGVVKVLDFGLAKAADASVDAVTTTSLLPTTHLMATGHGVVIGTVGYMSPEQTRGESIDASSDVWAFGCVLYEMLTGTPAFAAATVSDTFANILTKEPNWHLLARSVPADIRAVLRSCLTKERHERIGDASQLRGMLDGTSRLRDTGWAKPLKLALAAVAVVSLVVSVYLVADSWGVASADHEPVVVLITDFENQTNDPAFDHTLEPMLRMALEGAGFISAYDRTRIRSAFGSSPPDRLEPAAGRQLALKHGLGIVIDGSISRADRAYAIELQVSQPISGNVALRDRQRANGKDDVMKTVTQLAAKVRRVLGERMTESDQLFAMRTISATSFDVISNYAAGIELQSRGRYEEARQHFLKAVELDPDFALGFQSLSVNSRNTGNLNDAEKYARVAIEHLDGVTERERLSIRGNYYWVTGDLRQCVTEYAALIARYAGDTVARNQRALCLGKLGDMHGAMEELRRALSILPNHVTYRTNLAMFADYAGEFDVAEQVVRLIKEPSAPSLQALPLSLLGQGRTAEAVEAYQRLSEMGVWGKSFASAGLGDVALYEGRFADAAQIFQHGAAADLGTQRLDAAALKLVALANVEMSRARVAEATAAAEQALTHSKALPVRFLAARILAQAGQFDASRKVGSELGAQVAVQPQAYGKIIEAAMALKQGQSNAAIKLLTDANGMVDTWIGHFDLGRAYLEAGALPQADSEFDRCLKRRGEALSIVDEDPTYGYFPPVWYYRGVVRERMNDNGAIESFRSYLQIRGKSAEDAYVADITRRIPGGTAAK